MKKVLDGKKACLRKNLQDADGGEQQRVGAQREHGKGDDDAGKDLRKVRGCQEGGARCGPRS